MAKVKLITHSDLDGIGCEVVGRIHFDDIDVTVVNNPQQASDTMVELIKNKELDKFYKVFITDISVSKYVAELIDEDTELAEKLTLLDHHATADYLNQYSWAEVATVNEKGYLNSGTNMFAEYLELTNGLPYVEVRYSEFVEKVRRYDCWDWKNKYNDANAGMLNDLFFLIGRHRFVTQYVERINLNPHRFADGEWSDMFDKQDIALLVAENDKKDRYIKKKAKEIFITNDFMGHRVGVVYADQYQSELGNELSKLNPHCKFIMMIDMGSCKASLRTIHDDIDLGKEIASKFGGGGHSKASGFTFDKDVAKLGFFTATNYKPSFVEHVGDIIRGTGIIGFTSKMVDKFTKK